MAETTRSPLDGIQAKLARAGEQIDALEREIQALVAAGHYKVTGHRHHDTREYSFTASGPPLPPRVAVLAGEVVHHLRSCLDHLVWQLVLANGEQPSERTEFPICEAPEKFAEACKRKKIKGVSASAEKRIESLQPYHEAELHDSWLWVVHELDRIDKHRLLVVLLGMMHLGENVYIGSKSGPLTIIGMSPPKWAVTTEEGTEVFRVFFGDQYQRDVVIEPEFEATIVVERVGSVENPQLVPLLRASLDAVRTAIRSFDAEFPGNEVSAPSL